MMVYQEMLVKAKQAKSVDELMTMAKENNYALTREQAEKAFADFHTSSELSDEELDNVSGGSGCTEVEIGGHTYNKVHNSDKCDNDQYIMVSRGLADRHGNRSCGSCRFSAGIPGEPWGLYCIKSKH